METKRVSSIFQRNLFENDEMVEQKYYRIPIPTTIWQPMARKNSLTQQLSRDCMVMYLEIRHTKIHTWFSVRNPMTHTHIGLQNYQYEVR